MNGEHIKLHGVAKHQDFEGKACGTGAAEQRKDMELIEEIGANAVRLSHYQHPAYTYDLCDKMGFIVWAEIPMLAMPDGNEAIVENAKEQLKELILQNKHHPSICFWGVQNEIAMRGESQFTYNHVEKLNRIVKSLDPTRLSAGANLYSVKNDSPLNFINDAVGYNIYFGWYYGKLTDYEDFLNKFHEENPNVSLGISEYGVDCNTNFIVRSRNVRITLRNFSVCIMRLHMVHLRRIQSFGEALCGTCLISQVPFATKEE